MIRRNGLALLIVSVVFFQCSPASTESPTNPETSSLAPSELLIADFETGLLTNNIEGESGEWNLNPDDDTNSYSKPEVIDETLPDGNPNRALKLTYSVDSNLPSQNGFWTKLKNLDASGYDHFRFDVKGDAAEGFTDKFKIEIKKFDSDLNYTILERKFQNMWVLDVGGDINANGKKEVLGEKLDKDGNLHLIIYELKNKKSFSFKLLKDILIGGSTTTLAQFADLNGDGKSEIIGSFGVGGWTNAIRIYEWNNLNDSILMAWEYNFPAVTAINKIAIGDFDSDPATTEFVVADPTWGEGGETVRIQVFQNNGNDLNFNVVWSIGLKYSINYIGPSVKADYDGDGIDEFVVSFSDYDTGFHCVVFDYRDGYHFVKDFVTKSRYYGYTICTAGSLDNVEGDEIIFSAQPKTHIYSFRNGLWKTNILLDSIALAYSVKDWNQDGNNELFTVSLDSNTIEPGNIVYARFYKYDSGLTNTARIIQNNIFNFSLDQNYPNPFNPTTKIAFSVPERSIVSLKIYDILGQEIATLINEKMSAGRHSVDFNGERFASGTYFYKLEINGNGKKDSVVKKLTILK